MDCLASCCIISEDKMSTITLMSEEVGRISPACGPSVHHSRDVWKHQDLLGQGGQEPPWRRERAFTDPGTGVPVSHWSFSRVRHSLLVRRGESCPVLRRVPQQHPQGEAFPEHRPSKHFTWITTIGKATPHLRQSQSYNDLHRGENGFESFWSS